MPKNFILPAVPSDTPLLAQLMTDSYLPQAYIQFFFPLYPSPTHVLPFYAAQISSKFEDLNTQIIKIVNESSGDIVAFTCLTKESDDEKEKLTKGNEWLKGLELKWDFVANVVNGLGGLAECVQGRDHFVLSLLAVHPLHQGRSYGKQLVTYCGELADQEQVPIFLVAFPNAYGMYLKLGYEDRLHFDVDLSEYTEKYCGFGVYRSSGMVREPKASLNRESKVLIAFVQTSKDEKET